MLYVGKAKNLRARISQYINRSDNRHMLPYLLGEAYSVDVIAVNSEYEALLLERDFIKSNLPKYNAIYKDDKSFFVIEINFNDIWPKIDLVRLKDLSKDSKKRVWGPYTSSSKAKKLVLIAQNIFPIRRCSDFEFARRTKPCIYYDMKLCLAPCVNMCSKQQYLANVNAACKFFDGKFVQAINILEGQIQKACEVLDFETASSLQKSLSSLQSHCVVDESQIQIENNSGYAFAVCFNGNAFVVTCIEFKEGKPIDVITSVINKVLDDEDDIFQSWVIEYIEKMLSFKNYILEDNFIIVLANYKDDIKTFSDLLSHVCNRRITVFDDKKFPNWAKLALRTCNAYVTKNNGQHIVKHIQQFFGFDFENLRVDCIDNSHLHTSAYVSSVVVFENGTFCKNLYKTFSWDFDRCDDIFVTCECIKKHFFQIKTLGGNFPNVLVVDGGYSHYMATCRLLKEIHSEQIEVVSISKDNGKHSKGLNLEKIFCRYCPKGKMVDLNNDFDKFIQNIRDKAHSLAVFENRKIRSKFIKTSYLDSILGVGEVTKNKILSKYRSSESLKKALLENSFDVKISRQAKTSLFNYFKIFNDDQMN